MTTCVRLLALAVATLASRGFGSDRAWPATVSRSSRLARAGVALALAVSFDIDPSPHRCRGGWHSRPLRPGSPPDLPTLCHVHPLRLSPASSLVAAFWSPCSASSWGGVTGLAGRCARAPTRAGDSASFRLRVSAKCSMSLTLCFNSSTHGDASFEARASIHGRLRPFRGSIENSERRVMLEIGNHLRDGRLRYAICAAALAMLPC